MRKEYMKNMWMLVLMSVMFGQGVVALTSGTPDGMLKMEPVGTPSPGSVPGRIGGRIGGLFGRSPKQDSPTDLSKKTTQDVFSDSGLAPSTLKNSALAEQDVRRKALYAGMALYRNQNERTKQLTDNDEQQLQAIPGATQVLSIAQTTAKKAIRKNAERVRQFEALSFNTLVARSAPSGGGTARAGVSGEAAPTTPSTPALTRLRALSGTSSSGDRDAGQAGAGAGGSGEAAPTTTLSTPALTRPRALSGTSSSGDRDAGQAGAGAASSDASSEAKHLGLPTTFEELRVMKTEEGTNNFAIHHSEYGYMKFQLMNKKVIVTVNNPDGEKQAFHNIRNDDGVSFIWDSKALQYFEKIARSKEPATLLLAGRDNESQAGTGIGAGGPAAASSGGGSAAVPLVEERATTPLLVTDTGEGAAAGSVGSSASGLTTLVRSRSSSAASSGGGDAAVPFVTGTGESANLEDRPEDQPVAGQGEGAAGSVGSSASGPTTPVRSRASSAASSGGGPAAVPLVTDTGEGAAAGSVGSSASGSTIPSRSRATSASGQAVIPVEPLVGSAPATDPQGQPMVPAAVEPKNYKAAFGFAAPAAIVGAIWVWLAATKQGRELLGSMRKLFTKKGRASLTPQQKREAIEDLVTLAVTSGLGVVSGGYSLHNARKTYKHNKSLTQARTAQV